MLLCVRSYTPALVQCAQRLPLSISHPSWLRVRSLCPTARIVPRPYQHARCSGAPAVWYRRRSMQQTAAVTGRTRPRIAAGKGGLGSYGIQWRRSDAGNNVGRARSLPAMPGRDEVSLYVAVVA